MVRKMFSSDPRSCSAGEGDGEKQRWREELLDGSAQLAGSRGVGLTLIEELAPRGILNPMPKSWH